MLYMQYVKTGKLSAGLAKLFSSLQTMREKSDYNCSFNGLPEGEDASFFLCKELKTGYLDGDGKIGMPIDAKIIPFHPRL